MIERAVTFGPDRRLVGIVTDPGTPAARHRPAVIMLNAGLIHRVGPNRLHVHLARRLAADGFVSMRVDLSGRGDSGVRADTLSFAESGIAEARDAMRHLSAAFGISRFVMLGICSGATTAGDLAYADTRVAGAVIIEGASYPTRRFYARYYRRRLWRRETWWNTFTGTNAVGRRIRRTLGVRIPDAAGDEGGDMSGAAGAPMPTSAALAAAIQHMVERRVQLLAIFSGSMKEYNYAGQVREAFATIDFQGCLDERYFPQADHTFTRRQDQARLIDAVAGWMGEKFGAAIEAEPDVSADTLTDEAVMI